MSQATLVALRPVAKACARNRTTGLSRLDLKLGHQHPGGLTHLGPQQRVQLGPGIAVGVSNRGL